eukprot:12295461-Alexandrium_andersonii.AAC.1
MASAIEPRLAARKTCECARTCAEWFCTYECVRTVAGYSERAVGGKLAGRDGCRREWAIQDRDK